MQVHYKTKLQIFTLQLHRSSSPAGTVKYATAVTWPCHSRCAVNCLLLLQTDRCLFRLAYFGTVTTSLREINQQRQVLSGRGLTLQVSSCLASYLAIFCTPILQSEMDLGFWLHRALQGYKSGDQPEHRRVILWSGRSVSF